MSLESSSLPEYGQVFIDSSPGTLRNTKSGRNLAMAISVQAKEYPHRFVWAKDNSFALEYTPDPLSPHLIPSHVKPFIAGGTPVRFHCRFFDYEIGNADPAKAEEAIQVHLRVLDAITNLGEPVITVHLNLVLGTPFDSQRGVDNLARLAERGRQSGITVCLENLRRGPASNPENILKWAKTSGAMITLDVGHAVSSELVKNGSLTVPDFIDLFSGRLHEVHMYGKEEDRHYPIENLTPFKPIIDRLLTTDCAWWTIELDDYAEALNTREIIVNYLRKIK
jgi:sugar phosphate isomerase/epimerase